MDAGYTQRQLADIVKVAERTVQYWEADKALPSLESLQRLVEVLGPEVMKAFDTTGRKKRGRPKGPKLA
jgi:DNA-binding XRE family transcriptional regulator